MENEYVRGDRNGDDEDFDKNDDALQVTSKESIADVLRPGVSVCDIKITTTRICVALRVLQAGTVKGCNRAMLILITRLGRRPADPNSTLMLNSSESRGAGRSVRANFNFR